MERTAMDTERGSLIPWDTDSPKRDIQLRVTPTELKFMNAMAGRVYRLPVTLHNLGRWNQKIRFQEPIKPQFKLMLTSLDKELASGLQLTAMVEYHPDKDEDTFDQLLISTGNKIIEVPLIGLIPSCALEIESVVDFGTIVANSKVYCKEVTIINRGKAPGIFKTEYQGQLPILIFPASGVVPPKSSVIIKVDFCADNPRIVNEVAKASLQGHPDILLNIKAHVVEQIIELFNMSNDEKLKCIHFGSVFFGTSKIEHALLHNNSPESINWVAIMQNDTAGEELGANIHQRTDVALNNLTFLNKIKNMDATTFISCFPNEGTLLPYQKIVITFCFSPKLITDGKKNAEPSHRQDYALFLRFESVGSKDGFLRDDDYKTIKSDRFEKVELALTGSGLPVVLYFDPGKELNFKPCLMGERSDILCVVQNGSTSLSVTYRFQKTANFKIDPERGKIDEGCTQNVMCSFIPHQIGVFKVKQVIDIIGPVADENLRSTSMKPFHHIYLDFSSICKSETKKVMMKINSGISPWISNPTGHFVVKDLEKHKGNPPVAMLQSGTTDIHNHRLHGHSLKDALIAFPNDRVGSLRSEEHDKYFRTIFTKIPRHTFIDYEFEYTPLEKLEKRTHQDYYTNYIKFLRSVRLQKQADRKCMYSYNDTDIGIQPASGLKSPSLSEAEIEEALSSAQCPIKPHQLLSTRKIASKEMESLERKVLKGLKSKPSTLQEKHDCSLILSPKQIHQVIVGPSVLNFGNISVNSTNTHLLHIINMLPIHILIQLDINLKELKKTKQFSYVMTPTSSTYISMIFESPAIGKFWKSFTFTVNNIPGGHILVMANVLPVKLELSTHELILRPQGFMVRTCFRRTVSLYNRQNRSAQFAWQPVNRGKGMTFSIRPAKGTVEAYSTLECEVTWLPYFGSPERGEFILHVSEGNTLTLKCAVHVGHTKVIFLEPRILFSNSPQGLTTWRKAILHNVGKNHAYFKVCDESILPTINIIPSQGIIPYGGITVLNISCTPTVAEKFDTRAKVAIHRANIIDLRIGGSVEIADVEIKPNVFNFTGTYVGATQIIPFVIKNKGTTYATVEFSLKDFPEFSMDFKDKSGKTINHDVPYMYYLELEENASLEGGIAFTPKEVATYDFSIQIQINSFKASELYTEYLSKKNPTLPKTTPLIQPCHVQATVLQSPLKLSRTEFVYNVPLYEMDDDIKVTKTLDLELHNISKQDVQWTLNLSNTEKMFKNGTFKFSVLTGNLRPNQKYNISIDFCPNKVRKYTVDVPMHLNNNPICYRMLHLTGDIKTPNISFDPPFISFTPVPLDITTGMDINILPQNYFRSSTLNFQIPTAKLLDDDEIHPVSVVFPKGRIITGSNDGINHGLTCHLSFKSSKPVSFFTNLFFYDDKDNWFSLPVAATAENCILTIYPYLAIHLDEQKFVLKDDEDRSPMKSRGSFMLPSWDFRLFSTDSIYRSSAATKFYDADFTSGNLFVGMEVSHEHFDLDGMETPKKSAGGSLGKEEKNEQFFSPKEGSKAYNFFQNVVNAAQTWFSLFGWPEGPHSLSIPETIRRDVQKIQFYSSTSSPKKFSRQNDFSKYNKTIYDVLLHLSGRMPPGISSSQSLPVDNTERVIQLHSQHSSLLDFLNTQGGCISHILPEFLLEPQDYKKWLEISSSTNTTSSNPCTTKKECSVIINMNEFEAWSKRAWTDVFLQIYKVLVLSRVTPQCSSTAPPMNVRNTPKINPSFVSSNIYSNPERILLSWLNTNYENTRHIIWKNCPKGVIPPERWIINFDKDLIDGLVFATQLAAYCPFLIESHFVNMYTRPKCPEQYLHNCLIITNGFHEIGFDMNIQATDICDPNPILMLMLCVYMYERLPTYLPKKVITFHCTLYDTVMRQILVKNPSMKNLVYNATIVGRDAADFSLAQAGNVVTISPKNETNITLKFTSRFLHPAEASLLLISKPKSGIGGTTMNFALKGEVLNFKAIEILKCKSPCYQSKEVILHVKNPFPNSGDFSVILVESTTFVYLPSQVTASSQYGSHDDGVISSGCDTPGGWSNTKNELKTSNKSSFIREFFCSVETLSLKGKGSSSLELCYLPFDIHIRYCAIILSNNKIGELIYIVEGRGLIPLPSNFFPTKPSTPIDYSHSPEEYNKEDPVLYLKCELHQIKDVDLKLPLTNEAKEKALAFAAQQQMSTIEYERRSITGTLESSSIRVAIALLGLTKIEALMLFHMSKLKKPKSVLYTTELSLPEYFYIPKRIYIPQIAKTQTKLTSSQGIKPANKTGELRLRTPMPNVPADADGSVSIPLRFAPLSAGRYPCKILLTSRYDVRVFCIEGVVNEDHSEAIFEFETPAFEALVQNIPINNDTKNEWKCQIKIEGDWFYGPPILHVQPGETVQYPLTFRPILECEIMGKLTLQNEVDGMERIFDIKGIGKKPLALEHVVVECEVGTITNKSIMVPNYTRNNITFKVSSDLPTVWGKSYITVDPNNSIPYILHVCPWKRGVLKGTLSFYVKSRDGADDDDDESQDEKHRDRDLSIQKSESELTPIFAEDHSGDNVKNLRIWYQLEIHSSPGPPINTIEMQCIALETVCMEIPISNPKETYLHIDVKLSSASLSGLQELTLNPLECVNYIVWYSSATTGCKEESIVFQPEMGEEFWYLLRFTTEHPKTHTIPEMKCDLGKHIIQIIPLYNPTPETLELQVTNSNPENFVLGINRLPVTVLPHSTTELSVYFHPSALGRAGHETCINFHCAQFKEWKFYLSGIGLFPQTMATEKITTCIGCQSSVIICFKNPTKEDVRINVTLTSQEKPKSFIEECLDSFIGENCAFQLSSLIQTQGIILPPKRTIDIPVLFMPQVMNICKILAVIQMVRANGEKWPIDNFDELDIEFKRSMGIDSNEIEIIKWSYPIIGLPQAPLPKDPTVVIKCQCGKQLEEKVEVTLIGDFFGLSPTPESTEFSVIPKRNSYSNVSEDFDETHTIREFEYEVEYESEVMKSNLEPCLSLYLIRKLCNVDYEMISLVFKLIFTPKKPFRSHITLKLESVTDGIWKFPMMLIATEPEVNDVIDIEGVGLFKESTVDFRVTSQTRFSEPFTAHFLPGSDPEFFVKPEAGELPPFYTKGILMVVGFIPRMYSKKYKATLVIQTDEMYLLYEFNGLPPAITPLTNVKSKIDTTNKIYDNMPIRRRNFLRENSKVLRTGVSSTIKGAPLVTKNK